MARKKKRAPSNSFRRYKQYEKSAKNRKLPFELSYKRFLELSQQDCFICGSPPSNSYRHDRNKAYAVPFIYNGIDRIDNSRGYVVGNVAPCCADCNYAKKSKSLSELLLYIYRAYHHAIKPALEESDRE